MKRRIIASLGFDTQDARDTARQDIEKDHEKKQTDAAVIISQDKDIMSEKPTWILAVDSVFKSNAKNDADDSHVKLKAKLKDAKVLRGEITAHDCTHDDLVVKNCEETNFEREVK